MSYLKAQDAAVQPSLVIVYFGGNDSVQPHLSGLGTHVPLPEDGIHFTAEASKVVVQEILKVLAEKDWEPNLHYKSIPAEFGEDSPYDPIGSDGKSTSNVSEFRIDRIIHRRIHENENRRCRIEASQAYLRSSESPPSRPIANLLQARAAAIAIRTGHDDN
ncbi:hypothetical protein TIFTF001_009524 [Ficus carica]|uniref:SGNH hydrolase-type esterase domain-containing protein n=1 Tax=Ficus carica TaxID=3494 RepID=A0AA87ZVF2_FICCA|nr:hypothetical protein TIFTF001_009524 [Ficus carica]